jgi:hypothetical protein
MMDSIQALVDRSLEAISIGAEDTARVNMAHRKILDAIIAGDANGARSGHGSLGLLSTTSRGGKGQSRPNCGSGKLCLARPYDVHAETAVETRRR